MSNPQNKPSASNWFRWFDPRRRDVGTYAFILNRITALGLTLYLFLHLIVLGQLAKGPEGYDSFLKLIGLSGESADSPEPTSIKSSTTIPRSMMRSSGDGP